MNTAGGIANRSLGPAFGLETLHEVVAAPGGTIHVEDAALLFRGDYARSGGDLVISGDGQRLVVHGYFALEHRPRLVAPNGASLDDCVISGLVHAATGDVTAQAGAGPTTDATAAIGRVQKVTGSATVVRNGVSVALHVGDLVYKGDAVQTDAASSLAVSFLDGTLFNLSAGARMLLNEMVYQTSGTNNSALFSLVQGSITFVAGQVAKTGDMKVGTPVATMGIRGTAVHVTIEADNGTTTFSVMTEPDGHTGRFEVYDRNDPTKLLFTVSDPGIVAVVRPDGPYQVTFEQLPKPPVDVQTELAIVQLLFRTIAEAPRLPVFQGPSTGGGAGSSTAPNLVLPQPDPQTPTLPTGPTAPPNGQPQQNNSNPGGSGTPNRGEEPPDTPGGTPSRPGEDTPPPLALLPQTVTVRQDAALIATSVSQGLLGAAAPPTARLVAAHAGADPAAADTPLSGETVMLHGRYGTLLLHPDGTYAYLADHAAALAAGQHGADVFSYRGQAADGSASSATLTIDVVGVNDAPAATEPVRLATSASVAPRTITAAELLAGASDVDGDTLVVIGLRVAQGGGTLTDLGDGRYRYAPASVHGEADPVILAYTVSDGHGGTLAQTAELALPFFNAAPVVAGPAALADSAEDNARIVTAAQLLVGAADADGDTLSVSGLRVASGGGTLTDLGDGSYRYVPAGDASGPVVLAYTISDAFGGSVAQSARFTLTPVNDAPTVAGPVVLADSAEDTPRTLTLAQLLAGAGDVEGDTLSVNGLHVTSGGGSLTDLGDGNYRYVPDKDANGPVVLGYAVSDGHGGHVDQSARFTLTPVNDAPTVAGPVALADSAEDAARIITAAQLMAGADDVDGDALSVTGLHVTSGGGTLTDLGGGSYRYIPARNTDGPVSLAYTVSDGHGGSVDHSARFRLTPLNDGPIVSGPVTLANSPEDTPRTITVAQLLGASGDVEGDALSVTGLHVTSGGGTLTDLGGGSYRYVPDEDANGPVVLGYGVSDGHGSRIDESARFTVTPVNDAPTVSGPVTLADGAEDTPRTITVAQLLAGAGDVEGDTLSVAGLHVTSGGGSLTDLGGGSYRYAPAADADGPVTLGYTITDGHGGNVNQTAGFRLIPVNDAPTVAGSVILADSAEDAPRTITVAQLLAGAGDVEGDSLSVTGLHVTSGGGSLTDLGDGSYRYVPDKDANGPLALSYTITDRHGGHVDQSARFTVTPVNDAPTVSSPVTLADGAEDAPRTITLAQLLAGAGDTEGDSLSVTGLHVVSGGGSLADLGGSYRYAPAADANGPVVLGYTIADGHGGSVGQTAGFSLTPVNDAPVLGIGSGRETYTEDDPALAVAPDLTLRDVDSRMLSGASVLIAAGFHAGQDVLAVPLADGSPITAYYDPHTGLLTLSGAATLAAYLSALTSVTYANSSEAPSGDTRTLAFVITDDGGATSATISREVAVVPVNDAPTPHDDNAFVSAGSSVTLHVLDNDTDPEGDAVTLAAVGTAAHGSVVLNDDGTVTYTPDADFAGPDHFTYTAKDPSGATAQATVDLVVGFSAHKPVGTDVFLQGAYMEIGVSGSGSLGSSAKAPEGFHPQGSLQISFVIDTDGWGSGTTPTSNDVTLPGTPEDAIVIGYDGQSFANSERTGLTQFAAKTLDTSSGSHLQTTTIGLTAIGGAEVIQVIDLDPNASYFSTTVTLTNTSTAETLHDARFMRSFDPDQDAVFYGDYATDNDVLANPVGGGGAAIVQALGTHSGTSVNLVSFESGARASADAFFNHDAYAKGVYATPTDPNGTHVDVGISMDLDFGDLAPGQSVTHTFYTTLNTRSGANDLIVGTAGADAIDGKGGDDTIVGLGGDDTLTGGSGNDTFVFVPHGNDGRTAPTANAPTITDFTPDADVLQFDHTIFATADAALAHATQAGDDVRIAWDDAEGAHTVLTLRNLHVADLHLRDIHIV